MILIAWSWLIFIGATLSRSCAQYTATIMMPITTQDVIAGDVFFEIVTPQDLEYTYRLRPAKDFGGTFTKRKLEGVPLVMTDPPAACQKIKNRRDMEGSIALIDRGDCSFVTKALQAEAAGAVGAIVSEYDTKSTEFEYYIEMIHDKTDRDVNIPAGFLLGKNGVMIRSTLLRLKRNHALINIPVNLTFTPPSRINHPPWLGW